jgi:uncharacterized membrane protein
MRFLTGARNFLRRNFVTGFLVAVPFAVTTACLAWVWQQIDGPLNSFFHLVTGNPSNEGPWYKVYHALTASKFGEAVIPLVGLLLIILVVVLLGMIMRSFIGTQILRSIELGVGRLPLIGMLYGSIKQLGEAFISREGKSKFQRAVAVQFPCPGTWAIGFVTGPGDNMLRYVSKEKNALSGMAMVTVFVPCSPLPTAGFTLIVPVAETMDLEMTVQDALKMVVSGGMLAPIEPQLGLDAKPLPKPPSQLPARIEA